MRQREIEKKREKGSQTFESAIDRVKIEIVRKKKTHCEKDTVSLNLLVFHHFNVHVL